MLSPTLTAALATIETHGPLTPSELAERERVRRPTATRVVARLVELGLDQPHPGPLDGRAFLVAPTRRGQRAAEAPARAQERLPGKADAGPRPR